eukprot:UN32994
MFCENGICETTPSQQNIMKQGGDYSFTKLPAECQTWNPVSPGECTSVGCDNGSPCVRGDCDNNPPVIPHEMSENCNGGVLEYCVWCEEGYTLEGNRCEGPGVVPEDMHEEWEINKCISPENQRPDDVESFRFDYPKCGTGERSTLTRKEWDNANCSGSASSTTVLNTEIGCFSYMIGERADPLIIDCRDGYVALNSCDIADNDKVVNVCEEEGGDELCGMGRCLDDTGTGR